jgi:V8-like Glu-specific endopeptidase
MKMKRHLLIAAILIAAATIVAPSIASSASPTSRTVSSPSARSKAAVQRAVAHWTPARMKAARPWKVRGPAGAAAADTAPVHRSDPVTVAATAVPRPYTNAPDKFNGKVFFSHDGLDYVCSGTLINSPAKNVVWTAGHCVNDGEGDHAFHTNWVFVPAYSSNGSGNAPYGTWAAKTLTTTVQWAQHGNFRQDLGAANLVKVGGKNLGQNIGGQGIAFNRPAQQAYSDFGYPQAPPFNGNSQYRCDSPLVARDDPFDGPGPLTMKINCNMTGGSSGGGWLVNIDGNGLGTVVSVNSYGYTNDSSHEYGPYQGDEALALYNQVKGAK